MRLRCPHCGTFGTIRSSEVVTATVSRQYVMCNNLECGHTWRATTEVDLTLTPSAAPVLIDDDLAAQPEAADGASSSHCDGEIEDRFAARLRCAQCGELGTVRSSEVVSATVSRQYVICSNPQCAHAWRATTGADMTLSPSATPESTVALPLSSHMRRDMLAAQMRTLSILSYLPRRFRLRTTRDLFQPAGPS